MDSTAFVWTGHSTQILQSEKQKQHVKTTENNIHLTSPLKVRVFDLDSSEIPQWEGTVERLGENCAVVQSKSTTKDFNLNPPQTVHRVEFWSKNDQFWRLQREPL